jgi:hypothetical protein
MDFLIEISFYFLIFILQKYNTNIIVLLIANLI